MISNLGIVNANGTSTVSPLVTTAYEGTFWGDSGSAKCTTTLTVAQATTTTVTPKASCTFNNQTIADGQGAVAYQSSTVSSSQQCVSQVRTCHNGVLDGTYLYASCTNNGQSTSTPVGSCDWNGNMYPSGAIVTMNPQASASTPNSSVAAASVAMMCVVISAQYQCENGNWVLMGNNPCGAPGMVAAKPVIYLYPQKTEKVRVSLNYRGAISASYPEYNPAINGWDVTAQPDGTLTDATGMQYNYLFWEGNNYNFNIDQTKGFVVKGSDTQAFLEQKLAQLGLTRHEADEFIVYWLPKMQGNPYNFVQFVGSEYTNAAPLTITPKPDAVLRVFMAWKPLTAPMAVTPQTIAPFTRTGFTVVEWGGTEI